MLKKKVIGLSILLLVFLLGLSTVGYAVSPSKVKNMINTCMTVSGFSEEKREQEIATIDDTWLTNYDYDNIGIICYLSGTTTSGTWYIRFVNISQTNSQHPYRYSQNSTLWAIQGYYKVAQISFSASANISGSRYSYNTTTDSAANSNVAKTNGYFYTDVDIWSASSGGNVVYSAGTGTPSTFTPNGPYTDMATWGVISYPYDSITIPGIDTLNGDIYLSYFDSIYSPYQTWSGAWLGGADEIDSAVVKYWRYNRFARKWLQENNNLNGSFTEIDASDNSCWFYIANSSVYSDSFVTVTIKHKTDSSQNYIMYFYLATANTVINNGVLDITATINNYSISGDNGYYNNSSGIASEEQAQNTVNELTDNSQVAPIVSEFLGGSGEDVADKFGYNPQANAYGDFLTGFIRGLCDVIMDSGDVYFDISFHGEPARRIYSSSFYVPENGLKIFVRIALIFLTVVCFYQYINKIITAFNEGNPKKAFDLTDADVDLFKF